MQNYLQTSYFMVFLIVILKHAWVTGHLGKKPAISAGVQKAPFFTLRVKLEMLYLLYDCWWSYYIINRVQLKRKSLQKTTECSGREKDTGKQKKKRRGRERGRYTTHTTRHKLGETPGLVPSCAFMTNIRAERGQKLQNGPSFPEYLKQ